MKEYPDLFISTYRRRNGQYVVSVWVRRDGKDAEALRTFVVSDPEKLDLSELQAVAAEAKQKGLRVCNRCLKPKECPAFWYAARYCRECLEKDPELRAQIARENYR